MDEFAMGGSGETSYHGAAKIWDNSRFPVVFSGSAASVASGKSVSVLWFR